MSRDALKEASTASVLYIAGFMDAAAQPYWNLQMLVAHTLDSGHQAMGCLSCWSLVLLCFGLLFLPLHFSLLEGNVYFVPLYIESM